jgi:hypothetical protein
VKGRKVDGKGLTVDLGLAEPPSGYPVLEQDVELSIRSEQRMIIRSAFCSSQVR